MHRIAVIRISGKQGLTKEIKSTFTMLRLYNKYTCVIVPNNPKYLGMIKKIKDFITWGEINDETFRVLLEKRGKLAGNLKFKEEYVKEKINLQLTEFAKQFMDGKKELKELPGLKLFFKLHPPRGGFERNGTKKPYSVGGVLGYRKEKINDLIQRMI